jgi:hypothetical protein
MISYLTRVSKSSLLPKGGEEEIKKLIKGISKIDDTGADSAQAL